MYEAKYHLKYKCFAPCRHEMFILEKLRCDTAILLKLERKSEWNLFAKSTLAEDVDKIND